MNKEYAFHPVSIDENSNYQPTRFYFFSDEIDQDFNPGEEGGDLYAIDLQTGKEELFTLWHDDEPGTYYLCFPVYDDEGDDTGEVEEIRLDDIELKER